MALTRMTPAGWFMTSNGQLQTDRFGLSTATARWSRLDIGGTNPGSPTAFGNAHPLWTYLDCDKVSISQTEHGWEAEANFFGVSGTPEPLYEVDHSTSEEPIETHKDFRSKLGGKPGDVLHGAHFDEQGAFTGFTDFKDGDTETADTWRGIRAYLSPGVVWRKNYVTKSRPNDFGDVGCVDFPEGNAPQLPTGRNWLYVGLVWEQRGLTYSVKKEWRASGRRGWNNDIYSRG